MITPRECADGGFVIAEARGAGWTIEISQHYALIPLRSPAVRADDFVRKVLADGPVALNGVLLAARAIGLSTVEIKAAFQRADVVYSPGAGHHVQGREASMPPGMPSANAIRRHLAEEVENEGAVRLLESAA